jgi:hypothetical protein
MSSPFDLAATSRSNSDIKTGWNKPSPVATVGSSKTPISAVKGGKADTFNPSLLTSPSSSISSNSNSHSSNNRNRGNIVATLPASTHERDDDGAIDSNGTYTTFGASVNEVGHVLDYYGDSEEEEGNFIDRDHFQSTILQVQK